MGNRNIQLSLSFEDNDLVYRFHDLAEKLMIGEQNAMHAIDVGKCLGLCGTNEYICRKMRALRERHNSNDFPFMKKILSSQNGYYMAETKSTLDETTKQYSVAAYRKIKASVKMLNEARILLKAAGDEGQLRLALTKFTKKINEIGGKNAVENADDMEEEQEIE